MPAHQLLIRQLQQHSYEPIWQAMRKFTLQRQETTVDELWLLQHDPIFTQGLAGKAQHIIDTHHISVVHSDRGGQITYHGPGQLIAYVLLNLKRKQLDIRHLVSGLEQTIIQLLAQLNIIAYARADAPGVYVSGKKICSIGLRVRHNCSYHGIALNHDMDLTPFSYINPCGYEGLKMTQINDLAPGLSFSQLQQQFISTFCAIFGYTECNFVNETIL